MSNSKPSNKELDSRDVHQKSGGLVDRVPCPITSTNTPCCCWSRNENQQKTNATYQRQCGCRWTTHLVLKPRYLNQSMNQLQNPQRHSITPARKQRFTATTALCIHICAQHAINVPSASETLCLIAITACLQATATNFLIEKFPSVTSSFL